MSIEETIKQLNAETFSVKVLYTTIAGSNLYGTSTPTSDVDYKGIYIPSKQSYNFGKQFADPGFFDFGTGDDNRANTKDDVDCGFYSLESFFHKLHEGEAGATDILFSVWTDQIVYADEKFVTWCKENYSNLISSHPKAFIGFATGQARRYGVKGQRYKELKQFQGAVEAFVDSYDHLWLQAKISKLKSLEFQSFLTAELPGYTHIKITKADAPRGSEGQWEYLDILGKLIAPTCTVEHLQKKIDEYEDSYGMRVKNTDDGIDWKALSHATRAVLEIEELLIDGFIKFPLKDASMLLKIKQGEYRLDTVTEILEQHLSEIDELVKTSKLPSKEDLPKDYARDFINSYYE